MATDVIVINGHSGGLYVDDMSLHSAVVNKPWQCIETMEVTVIASIGGGQWQSLVGKTLPANKQFFGQFTSIQLTSGSVALPLR